MCRLVQFLRKSGVVKKVGCIASQSVMGLPLSFLVGCGENFYSLFGELDKSYNRISGLEPRFYPPTSASSGSRWRGSSRRSKRLLGYRALAVVFGGQSWEGPQGCCLSLLSGAGAQGKLPAQLHQGGFPGGLGGSSSESDTLGVQE